LSQKEEGPVKLTEYLLLPSNSLGDINDLFRSPNVKEIEHTLEPKLLLESTYNCTNIQS
jgi:hypothetical protein